MSSFDFDIWPEEARCLPCQTPIGERANEITRQPFHDDDGSARRLTDSGVCLEFFAEFELDVFLTGVVHVLELDDTHLLVASA